MLARVQAPTQDTLSPMQLMVLRDDERKPSNHLERSEHHDLVAQAYQLLWAEHAAALAHCAFPAISYESRPS